MADDLTGAADSSVHFASRREVVIRLPGAPPVGAALVAIDTESRELPPGEAAARVAAACRGLEGRVFKKVDSTLRGSVAEEVEAARSALGLSRVVLAPSLPAQGRVVHGYVEAETDADLDRVAADCLAHPDWLPAGSAGLAAAFARLEGPAREPPPIPTVDRVVVLVASRNPVSQAQAEVLGAARPAGVELRQGLAEDLPEGLRLDGRAAVIATGGDAAIAFCRAFGLTVLRPRREVAPGMVLSETERPGLLLVTKAGGFGGPDTLLDAALKLLGDG